MRTERIQVQKQPPLIPEMIHVATARLRSNLHRIPLGRVAALWVTNMLVLVILFALMELVADRVLPIAEDGRRSGSLFAVSIAIGVVAGLLAIWGVDRWVGRGGRAHKLPRKHRSTRL